MRLITNHTGKAGDNRTVRVVPAGLEDDSGVRKHSGEVRTAAMLRRRSIIATPTHKGSKI
jgi:hypothetical protein